MEFFCERLDENVIRRDCRDCTEFEECKNSGYLAKVDKQLRYAPNVLPKEFQPDASPDLSNIPQPFESFPEAGFMPAQIDLAKREMIANRRAKELEKSSVPIPDSRLQEIVHWEIVRDELWLQMDQATNAWDREQIEARFIDAHKRAQRAYGVIPCGHRRCLNYVKPPGRVGRRYCSIDCKNREKRARQREKSKS